MSLQLTLVNWILRKVERPSLIKIKDPSDLDARLHRQARLFCDPGGTYVTETTLAHDGSEVPALIVTPKETAPRAALLYLHGGGYVVGSSETHRKLAARIALKSRLETFLPDYRLSTNMPFPAALSDALTSYDALLERGYNQIAIAGDSAGGGLAFAMLHEICTSGRPMPFAMVGLCPWTDLTLNSPSLTENAATEVILPPERMDETVAQYIGAADPSDPRISPVFGSFRGAPPTLLQVSQAEILYDDTLRLADQLRAFEVDVHVQSWERTFHVWHMLHGWLPEANEATRDIASFLARQLANVTR